MSDKIPNPFKKEWAEFDLKEFKEEVCELIDEIVKAKDEDDVDELMYTLDDELAYLIMLLRFKDQDTLEVIRMDQLSKEKLLDLGLTEEEIEDLDPDAVMPVMELFGFDLADLEEDKKPKKNKKDWLV